MSSNLYGIPGEFDVVVIGGDPAGAKECYWERAQTIVDPKRERDPREDFDSLASGPRGRHLLFNTSVDDLNAERAVTANVRA